MSKTSSEVNKNSVKSKEESSKSSSKSLSNKSNKTVETKVTQTSGEPLLKDKGLWRKRLIYIRRSFTEAKKGMPSHAFLSGAHTYHNKDKTQTKDWYTFNAKFYSDPGLRKFNQKLKTNRKPFTHFQVIIPSLLYIGAEGETQLNQNSDEIKTHFRELGHKQLGTHVFIARTGCISSLITFIDKHNNYQTTDVLNVNSVYPVVRYEWESHKNQFLIKTQIKSKSEPLLQKKTSEESKQRVVFGLHFKNYSNYKTGDRYYHNHDTNYLKAGGVHELTEEYLNDICSADKLKQYEPKHFCLFLCAGAKLIVSDQFHDKEDHIDCYNISLIQQGGVVFVDGELEVAFPRIAKNDEKTDGKGFVVIDWTAFVKQMRDSVGNRLNGKKLKMLREFKNPILFLGPIDSECNSIAWNLSLERNKSDLKYRRPVLLVPERAHIVAIADGKNGRIEVLDRIYYEFLHDSVVTEHMTQFRQIDGIYKVRNVLNIDNKRSVKVLLKPYIEEPTERLVEGRRRPLFVENNTTFLSKKSFQPLYEYHYSHREAPLPVPPMYPPYYHPTDGLFYLPTNDLMKNAFKFEDFYPKDKDVDPKSLSPFDQKYLFNGHKICLLQKRIIKVYNWERISKRFQYEEFNVSKSVLNINGKMSKVKQYKEPHQIQNDFKFIDGIQYRIGIDGWVWRKVGQKPIGLASQLCYCFNSDATQDYLKQNKITLKPIPPKIQIPVETYDQRAVRLLAEYEQRKKEEEELFFKQNRFKW